MTNFLPLQKSRKQDDEDDDDDDELTDGYDSGPGSPVDKAPSSPSTPIAVESNITPAKETSPLLNASLDQSTSVPNSPTMVVSSDDDDGEMSPGNGTADSSKRLSKKL